MKKLLLVIDMVNGFVKEGALADKQINNITTYASDIRKVLLETASEKNNADA